MTISHTIPFLGRQMQFRVYNIFDPNIKNANPGHLVKTLLPTARGRINGSEKLHTFTGCFQPMIQRLASCQILLLVVALLSPRLIAQTTVVSAASFQPVVAPGSIATVFGSGFSSAAQTASADINGLLPTQLGGVTVDIGGQQCQLFYVSPTQINLLIPASASTGQVAMSITTASGSKMTTLANITQHAPAIFQINGNRGAVTNAANAQLEPVIRSSASLRRA